MTKRTIINDLLNSGKTVQQIIDITGFAISTVRYYKDKKRQHYTISRISEHRRRIKRKAIDYSGGECMKCGYNKCFAALDFHHLDPTAKETIIATGRSLGWPLVKQEVDKTILICANCHREFHDGYWAPTQVMIDKQLIMRSNYVDQPLAFYNGVHLVEKSDHYCKCGQKVQRLGRNCDKCKRYQISKSPTKDKLATMIWEMPTTKIAIIYGVSDKAVEKWCKKFGLTKPSPGYWAKRRI